MISSKISKRYARALLGLGQEDGHYVEYRDELQAMARFCRAHKEYFQVLAHRIFSVDERKKVLEIFLAMGKYSPVVKNFMRLLLDKERIGAIQEIADYYAKLVDESTGVTRAKVIAARPLKAEARASIEKALAGLTSKEVKLEVTEDASLIGGVIVKLGDLVLDGSVRAQIESLKESFRRGE